MIGLLELGRRQHRRDGSAQSDPPPDLLRIRQLRPRTDDPGPGQRRARRGVLHALREPRVEGCEAVELVGDRTLRDQCSGCPLEPGGLARRRNPRAQVRVGGCEKTGRVLGAGLERLRDPAEELGPEEPAQHVATFVVPGPQECRELPLGQQHDLAELLTGEAEELADERSGLLLGVRATLPAPRSQALEVDGGRSLTTPDPRRFGRS